jgi:hypothetical protein
MAATRVEQFLFTPGVATFHAGEEALCFTADNQALIVQRAGVPMPSFVYVASSAVDLLRRGFAAGICRGDGGLPCGKGPCGKGPCGKGPR